MEDDKDHPADILLNEGDRNLVRMTTTLLASQEPGEVRQEATEHLIQAYHHDLIDAHPGVEPEALKEMTGNFGAALLLAMERRINGEEGEAEPAQGSGGPVSAGPRILEAIARMLKAVGPRQ